ncbi:MAG TPA: type II toxin-antitoxin system RelE/ParE family toxin [Pyrinomonadaceae bacterium]|nr:type II toxin-antitoxin system RelE/ParE family toxin [Pyrinomonadaceae bacterium]
MIYSINFKSRAIKDLNSIELSDRRRIAAKIDGLRDNLTGDVKRLTNFMPEYRLRVGRYRVLFEVEGEKVIIYRVKHRRDAYT